MIQVDLPAAFTVGQVFAWLAKDYLKKDPSLYTNRLLGPFNAYLSCGFATGGLFLLVGWPAWEGMYESAWTEGVYNNPLVAAFYILFVIVMILLGNIGFILAHWWLKKGNEVLVRYGIYTGLGLTLLPFALKWGVWFKIGTFAQVKAGGGYPFMQPPFFYGWLFIMSYMVVTGIAAGLWFKIKGNKLTL